VLAVDAPRCGRTLPDKACAGTGVKRHPRAALAIGTHAVKSPDPRPVQPPSASRRPLKGPRALALASGLIALFILSTLALPAAESSPSQGTSSAVAPAAELVREALAAEARQDPARALELFLAAERAGRADAFVLQKIARQSSDLMLDLPSRAEQRAAAERALAYSQRAVALEPRNAVNVLSVAISYGKLALVSDTREKVRLSRQIRAEAERALALDPNYAWAHHILGRWHREVAELGAASRAVVALFYGGLPAASPATAQQHLERAVALEPEELQHHIELGFILLVNGDTQRARSALTQGLALPSRNKIDEPAKNRARAALAKLDPAGRK
jgi:tetratricopeptide (TPR) repeat protein